MVISFLTYRFLTIFIGTIYPSYQTYKSLKYQQHAQYPSLLCYWMLYSLFQIIEYIFDPIFSLILPFYFELKFFFIFWLTYKNFSQLIYSHLIYPYINLYETDIDYLFNNTIYRLTEYILKFILFTLNQQQQITTVVQDKTSIKTNFASQYRKYHSLNQRQ